MRLAVLVMTDGRYDLLARCIDSLSVKWLDQVDLFMHDDSGDEAGRRALAERFPLFTQIGSGPRRGFGGAYRHAWQQMASIDCEYVFATEDDFLFALPVDLTAMVSVLESHPHLVQMALRRQAWNAAEIIAGGVVEQHPDEYFDQLEGTPGHHREWLEHRRFFTTNPSVYRRSLCERGWPDGRESEGRFGIDLFAEDPARRSAFWGARTSPPAVEHIGRDRVGTGY